MESNRKPGGLAKFRVTNREECGLIIRRREEPQDFLYVVKIPNHAEYREDYAIWLEDVEAVRGVLSDDEEIIGFMHTHLPHHDHEPSDRDFEGAALYPEMEYLIYQPSTCKYVWYGPEVLVET